MNNLYVLSLFDGISCGRLALNNLGITPDKYFASEVDKNAITINQKNFPDTIQIGDVTEVDFNTYKGVDLLMGGSPCQNFSFAGTRNGLKVKDEEIFTLDRYLQLKEEGFKFSGQSYLFWEFVDALRITNAKYFFLENVIMAKKWQDIISYTLGVEPIKINSAKFSAQNRRRLYWTNIPVDKLPEKDSDLTLEDIVFYNDNENWLDGNLIKVPHSTNGIGGLVPEGKSTWVANPSSMSHFRQSQRVYSLNGKSTTLTTSNQTIYDFGGKYRRLSIAEQEILQGLPVDYTAGVSKTARVKAIGNGWQVDTIEFLFKNLVDIYG